MRAASIPFSDLKPGMKTGDVILFHGNTLIEEAIQIGTMTDWSHVAMVVLPEDAGMECKPGTLLLWESSPIGYFDYETGKVKSGPHLISLTELLDALVKLSKKRYFSIRSLDCERNSDFKSRLVSFISSKSVLAATFPGDRELIEEFIEGHFEHRKAPDGTYFCSQLLAQTYMSLGLLTTRYPSNSYSPKSFSSAEKLELLKGAVLKDEILIDYSNCAVSNR